MLSLLAWKKGNLSPMAGKQLFGGWVESRGSNQFERAGTD